LQYLACPAAEGWRDEAEVLWVCEEGMVVVWVIVEADSKTVAGW
jgi:hypothetical protein